MIITDEKILRQKSEDFKGTLKELDELITKLEYELENSEYPGVGLAAIQIGIPLKVGILRTEALTLNLFNTEILSGSELKIKNEGCLSFPNKFINVYRMDKITINNGNGSIYELDGFEAQAVQHEIDHFNAITMFDRQAI